VDPASVLPAASIRTRRPPESFASAASSSPWTVRTPACACEPANSVPSYSTRARYRTGAPSRARFTVSDELDLDDLGGIALPLPDVRDRVYPDVRSAYLGAISSKSLLTTSGSSGSDAMTARRADRSPLFARPMIRSTCGRISFAFASVVFTRS